MLVALIVFLPMIMGPALYCIGRRNDNLRDIIAIVFTFLELGMTLLLLRFMPSLNINGILVQGITFKTDGFRAAYSIVTAIMWAGTTMFAKEYFLHEKKGLDRYWMFILVTLGATEGVMLSGDLMTAFIFFEILSFTSFTWVIHEETKAAIRAGYTYLFIAVFGGLVLFMGLLMLKHSAGTLVFDQLRDAVQVSGRKKEIFAAAVCILLGFGAKAGMFPLHVWLPKAHPVAPSPASALLSGILTKVGVYGILTMTLQVMTGNEIFGMLVLILGLITMVSGAVLALFSVNLKRTLACSSMSQIGFILTGIAMSVLLAAAGEEEGVVLALSGSMLHMVNHSMIKLTLFMAAGVVVMNIHLLRLDDIRGWGRNKTVLKIAFALGALGISGVPMFNGYISKTMLHEGIVEGAHAIEGLGTVLHAAEWIFLVSGGITFAYMLKLFICIFVEKNTEEWVQMKYDKNSGCMNGLSTAAIAGASLFMIINGQPFVMTRLAAFMTGSEEILHFHAFTAENLKGGAISLGIGLLVYLIFVRKVLVRNGSYVDLWPEKLDMEDLIYRPALKIIALILAFFGRILVDMVDMTAALARGTFMKEVRVHKGKDHINRVSAFAEESIEAAKPLLRNFTFAMMMTCIGILIILIVLIFYVV